MSSAWGEHLSGTGSAPGREGNATSMNDRERFQAIMDYRPFDRLPAYYFGYWAETLDRWKREGLADAASISAATGMDDDWEAGMWNAHGLVNVDPVSPDPSAVLEETDDYRVVRTELGAVLKEGKRGSSIPLHIQDALQPTREGWARFKRFLDPSDWARRRSRGGGGR